MFEVGEKLVCVKGGPPLNGNLSEHPMIQGSIYVAIAIDPPNHKLHTWGVRVAGNKTWTVFGQEVWWDESRFRKLSDMQAEARARKKQDQPI